MPTHDWKEKSSQYEDVKVINVTQRKGFRVTQIFLFGISKLDIDSYLPEYDYAKEPNCCWLANVINSLIGKNFNNIFP